MFIIAEDVDGEALATLVVNKLRGTINGAGRQGPGLRRPAQGDAARHRDPHGRPTSSARSSAASSTRVTLEDFGGARRVVSTKDDTTIVDGEGDADAIKARMTQIKAQIEETTSDYDREKLQERLAKLAGGVAVIKVGAATEVELKEKKHRIEDALSTTRAAVEEGIVAGGGTALLQAIPALDELKLEGDEQIGVTILRRALEAPLRQIAENAGKEGSVVVAAVRKGMQVGEGYDALHGRVRQHVRQGHRRRRQGDAFRPPERRLDRGHGAHDGDARDRQAREEVGGSGAATATTTTWTTSSRLLSRKQDPGVDNWPGSLLDLQLPGNFQGARYL